MKKLAVVAHIKDNVATVVTDLKSDQEVIVDVHGEHLKIRLVDNIPFGHKFAIEDIKRGEEIIKYGAVIGRATQDISIGEHVHIHNIKSIRGRGDLKVHKK